MVILLVKKDKEISFELEKTDRRTRLPLFNYTNLQCRHVQASAFSLDSLCQNPYQNYKHVLDHLLNIQYYKDVRKYWVTGF